MRIACVTDMNWDHVLENEAIIRPFGSQHYVGPFKGFTEDVEANGNPDLVIMNFSWFLNCLPYNSWQQKSMHALSDVPHIIVDALAMHKKLDAYKDYANDPYLNVIAAMSIYDVLADDKYSEIIQDFIDFKASVSGNPHFKIDADNFKIYRQTLKRDTSVLSRPYDALRHSRV
ncbi:MAG TPA: hypothetical protein VIN59_03300 [Alphaproteobacteria bacterium]